VSPVPVQQYRIFRSAPGTSVDRRPSANRQVCGRPAEGQACCTSSPQPHSLPAFRPEHCVTYSSAALLRVRLCPALGMPPDGMRHVPDVSLNAAFHTPYLLTINGALQGFGGTSAAAPSFAGLMALVEQENGQWLGNANYNLYGLAIRQFTGVNAPPVFHDVTAGDNRETFSGLLPNNTGGVSAFISPNLGYDASPGYDQATGLGSVDATQLVNGWPRSLNAHW